MVFPDSPSFSTIDTHISVFDAPSPPLVHPGQPSCWVSLWKTSMAFPWERGTLGRSVGLGVGMCLEAPQPVLESLCHWHCSRWRRPLCSLMWPVGGGLSAGWCLQKVPTASLWSGRHPTAAPWRTSAEDWRQVCLMGVRQWAWLVEGVSGQVAWGRPYPDSPTLPGHWGPFRHHVGPDRCGSPTVWGMHRYSFRPAGHSAQRHWKWVSELQVSTSRAWAREWISES